MKVSKAIVLFLVTALTLFGVSMAFGADAPVITDDSSFFSALMDYVKAFFNDSTDGAEGKASLVAKICGGIILLISTMKVSFLKPLWDKLLTKQDWVAPVLGLVVGICGMVVKGEFDWGFLLTAVASGALAPYIHDILDKVKAIPGLGKIWLTIIDLLKAVLGAPKENSSSL